MLTEESRVKIFDVVGKLQLSFPECTSSDYDFQRSINREWSKVKRAKFDR